MNRSDPKQQGPLRPSAEPAGAEAANRDVALVSGRSRDGNGLMILRSRRGQLEAGEVRPLAQGKPIQGEVVRLTPRKECPVICDVETVLESAQSEPTDSAGPQHIRGGPPQVASDAYRKNWDAIYRRGKKQQFLN